VLPRRKLSPAARNTRIGLGVVAAAMLAGGAYFAFVQGGAKSPHEHWAMLDRYCVDCHNDTEWTADLAFNVLSPESIQEDPALFEEVVTKLRGRQMPPPNGPRPNLETVDEFVHWLEATLDERAAQDPNPGYVALHRLNRTEYAYAIEDLLALRIDASALLPKDDESDGFDNVANVLKVSPSFLEQYISAARVVSSMAVGDPNAKFDSRVYYAQPDTIQNKHIEGMPLGTRGGMVVDHYFPVDGEYSFSIGDLVLAGYVPALEYRHKLILLIDGHRVFEGMIGGEEDLKNVDQNQATAVAEIRARFEDIRVAVTAGHHKLGVTFEARTFAESDYVLQPFEPGGGETSVIAANRLEIEGPFNPTGLSSTPSRERIFVCRPETEAEEAPCAERILGTIARRAFRRDVTAADLAAPMQFYREGREAGDFDAGIRNGLLAIVASPKFLYRAEPPPEGLAPGSIYRINDFELATRLSFFLWSRSPDDELLDLAASGRLRDADVLEAQVERMLADPRSETLVTNFAFQWLDLRGLSTIDPDTDIFPEFNKAVSVAFEKEMSLFLDSILRKDRSVLDVLRADHTFVNERLALHYGITDVRGDQFREIKLEDPNRWGLLGKGSVLMVTSYPNRTAPVLRGAWILESVLGTPPASPPPNVEALPETQEGGEALTVRERLEMHRENPNCAGCHDVMDGLGFALENFDAIGQWREMDRDAGDPIDSSGVLADGTAVSGPVDLREALLARPEQFVHAMTEKLLLYALGRNLDYYDMPAVRKIVHGAAEDDYRFSSLLMGVVTSDPFQMRRIPLPDEQPIIEARLDD
jgi:mono/diheme cytochrome c family protein